MRLDSYYVTYSFDAANRLTGANAVQIGYDCKGNLIADGTFTFTYDPENRLKTANKAGQAVSYAYDPAGHRTTKTVTGGSYAGITFYLSSGDDEIAEYGSSGALLRRFVPGAGIDQPIAMVAASGSKSFFHQDKTGSVIAMSDASGAVTEGPYTYESFGTCAAGGQPCAGGVPYRYTGRRLDPETGLYYYRARYYSASLGRFLQTDPIGYKDDINWYAYVANDPTDETDPTGMIDNCYNKGNCPTNKPLTPEQQQAVKDTNKELKVLGAIIAIGAALIPGGAEAEAAGALGEEGVAATEATTAVEGTATAETGAATTTGTAGTATAGSGSTAVETTVHGATRIEGSSATRGGVLSEEGVTATRASGQTLTQSDGAQVFLRETSPGKFDVVVQNQSGRVITTFKGVSQKSVDRLSKNYGWH